MNKLEKALSNLLEHGELTSRLASVLARASERGRVAYREVEKMVNGDALIAELKGSGVMSPKLGSIAEVSREGTPIYELNPSLFTRKARK